MPTDPSTLTGKRLWLRAKDTGTGSVASWAPPTGTPLPTGTSAGTAPTVATASTPNGGKSVRFGGAGNFTFPEINLLPAGASTEYDTTGTYAALNAVDGNSGTAWASSAATAWLRINLASAYAATQYTITPRSTALADAPKTFTFQGSNDGSTWTTLDTRSSISWPTATAQTFTFSNTTAYEFYKLDVTVAGTLVQVADLAIPGATLSKAGEVWAVLKVDSAVNTGLWAFGADNGATDESHYPYSGVVYDSFGVASNNRQSFTPSVAITSWRLYRVVSDGTTWQAWLDNTSQATAATKPVGWTRTVRLGRGRSAGSDDLFFTGNIAEILVRNRVSTSGEVADLITYFNTEHGLTVAGGSGGSATTGTVAVTGNAGTVASSGTVTTAGTAAIAGNAGAVSSSGSVAGTTSGTVAITGNAGSVSSSGTVPTPITGTVAVTGTAGTVYAGSAAGSSATIPLGLRIDTLDVQKLTVKTLTEVDVPVAMSLTVSSLVPVIPLSGDIAIPLALSLVARPSDTVGADPRTGHRQWRYVVTDLAGNPLGELPKIEHEPVADGINEPATMGFTIAVDDPSRALIKPIERQCQVWEGSRLLLRGPILPGRTSDDGSTVTHQIHDPSWYWRGGRRVIGRIPRLDLLFNGDFSNGLAGWTPGFDADSIPAAAPAVTVVADDFSNDSDGLNPIKAAQITGVESVTQTKSTLDSAAVFYPNRPFDWEPLAAGFKPGGAAQVDAVATAMPSTAGLKVTIVGHTANDGTGSGIDLSKRRAQAAAARVAAIRPGAVITTKGVGFYDPDPAYPVYAPQQRRVVISYESTVTVSAKSKQWIRQTVEVMQPKSARYPLELTAAAMVKVADDWSVQDANMVALKVVARRKSTPTVVWQESSTSLSDTDPVERYIGESTSVTIPADDRPYLVDVYLYAAAALTRYAMVGLFPEESLYFWGTDQADIVKGLVQHMQSTALGHGNLNVGTRTPLTGIKRDRSYVFREHMPVETALDEFPSLNRGMDIDTLCTANTVTVATFYPRQGQVLDYVLVQGGQIVRATPATTRDVGSSIIAQAQDIGSYRAEAYASDKKAFGGLMLERVITAEQESPLNELGEIAKAELGWASTSTVAYWVDIDPKRMTEVLANTNKGDTVRAILDAPNRVDSLVRIVKREIHPSGLRLMLALEE